LPELGPRVKAGLPTAGPERCGDATSFDAWRSADMARVRISIVSESGARIGPGKAACSKAFGMMLANIPAVLLGNKVADKLPVKAVRITAAAVFAILGLLTLTGVGK
jgi:hypothetical protein